MEGQNVVPILPNNASQNCAANAVPSASHSSAVTKASNDNVSSLVSPSSSENVLENVNNEIKFLENYIQNIGKNFNKNHVVELMKFTSNIKTCFTQSLIEQNGLSNMIIKLQTSVAEKDQIIINLQNELLKKPVATQLKSQSIQPVCCEKEILDNSYATKLKKPAQKYSPIIPVTPKVKPSDSSHVLILEAKSDRDKLSQSEFQQAKENILKVLQPTKLGVGIKSSGLTSKGGVVLSFQSKEDCEKSKDVLDKNPGSLDFSAKIPPKLMPKMTIIGVGNDQPLTSLQSNIIEQNTEIKKLILEGNTFKILFITKNGDAVIKLSPNIRSVIKDKGFLCCNLKSFNVIDRFYFKSCFKCCRIGHNAYKIENGKKISTCPNEITCAHCSGNHAFIDCPVKENQAKAICVNFKESKFHKNNITHNANDSSCPCINYNIKKLINITDFGTNGY